MYSRVYVEITNICNTKNFNLLINNSSSYEEKLELKIGTTVTKGGVEVEEGEEIFERQILRYTVVLKNTTSKPLNNVKIKRSNLDLFIFNKSIC